VCRGSFCLLTYSYRRSACASRCSLPASSPRFNHHSQVHHLRYAEGTSRFILFPSVLEGDLNTYLARRATQLSQPGSMGTSQTLCTLTTKKTWSPFFLGDSSDLPIPMARNISLILARGLRALDRTIPIHNAPLGMSGTSSKVRRTIITGHLMESLWAVKSKLLTYAVTSIHPGFCGIMRRHNTQIYCTHPSLGQLRACDPIVFLRQKFELEADTRYIFLLITYSP
jgi:hypothetical protein